MRLRDRTLVLLAAALALLVASGCYVCTQQNCADGCCNSEGICIVASTDDRECGTSGFACSDCTLQQGVCRAGQCVASCQSTCNGCCNGDLCLSATAQNDNQCGSGGASCTGCGFSRECQQGRCCISYLYSCTTSAECCSGLSCTYAAGSYKCR